MNLNAPYSDQLYNWSVNARKPFSKCSAQTPQEAAHTAPRSRCPATRLAHRALQALRQSQLPLSKWPRSRPEILPLCQLSEVPAQNGLRAGSLPGESARIPRALRFRTEHAQRDQRHQQRVVTSARNLLTDHPNGSTSNGERTSGSRRYRGDRDGGSENDKGLVTRRSRTGNWWSATRQWGGQPS